MKDCANNNADAHLCKWAAPGDHCLLTVDECHFEGPDPLAGWDPVTTRARLPNAYVPPIESALATQVGGGHYKDMPIQPVEFIHKNGIGFIEGSVIKYVSRWRKKNGVEDLKKARHFLDLLIEMEGG